MRLRIIIPLICLLLGGTLSVSAQDELHIGEFFRPDFQEKKGVTAVDVEGIVFMEVGNTISMFRSLKVKDAKEIEKIERAVKRDAAEAQTRTFSMVDGNLLYGYYTFRPGRKKNINRYVIYVHRPDSPGMLIYMEGIIEPAAFEYYILKKYAPSSDEIEQFTN